MQNKKEKHRNNKVESIVRHNFVQFCVKVSLALAGQHCGLRAEACRPATGGLPGTEVGSARLSTPENPVFSPQTPQTSETQACG